MDEALFERIRERVARDNQVSCPVASQDAISAAESKLTFSLPPLLRACLTEIGNGRFGPGYGLMCVEGGTTSDSGELVDVYYAVQSDSKLLGKNWPKGVLPFCNWGCNLFSCVDCTTSQFTIWTCDELELSRRDCTLDQFFELWLDDGDISLLFGTQHIEKEIINPFTGKKASVKARSR
jgi:hypothetical protein